MDRNRVVDYICTMLGLKEPTEQVEYVVDSAINSLKILIGASEVPEEMTHVVTDVAIRRYNKIGSEGMKSHNVEGESITFADNEFDGFMGLIEAYLDEQNGTKRGRVRFL